MFQFLPSAVLYPKSVSDILISVKHAWQLGPHSELKIAARGRGHFLQGQSQAHQGVVIKMESIQGSRMKVHIRRDPYVDVSGGELWINILKETLQYGLIPKSWTDYLHLTIGGTLSNAGVSGQAFKHGPQISNVHRLQIVTGKGEVLECSKKQNEDLFYSTLGGLGQFGIITRARISLEQAPTMASASNGNHCLYLLPTSQLKIAARGRGHSLQGQSQAHQGVIIKMESIQDSRMKVHIGRDPYMDVSGGELWINILRETLQYGLTPKLWTDYLHLTIDGTLSNAGVSGQAFKHGPQISNVHRLQIVTGKGEVLECSKKQNEDLFYSTLERLSQRSARVL